VEHVERQDEREAELRADADQLEQQGDEMDEQGERLSGQIDETREDFERKKESPEVPGLQEEAGFSPDADSRIEASGQPGDVQDDDDE